jgi:hypothetical protein
MEKRLKTGSIKHNFKFLSNFFLTESGKSVRLRISKPHLNQETNKKISFYYQFYILLATKLPLSSKLGVNNLGFTVFTFRLLETTYMIKFLQSSKWLTYPEKIGKNGQNQTIWPTFFRKL